MLSRFLGGLADFAYALLRWVSGLMFAFHGAQKIFGIFSQHTPPVGSQVWVGGIIELVTGLLIATGVGTPITAFLASGTMAVAYVQFHCEGRVRRGLLPHCEQGRTRAALLRFVSLHRVSRQWSVGACPAPPLTRLPVCA